MQLKRQSVEACRMKNIIQKGMIPARTQFQDKNLKPVEHVKYEGQVGSGQVTTFAVCAAFSLSIQAVVLLMKTAIYHCFFQSSLK